MEPGDVVEEENSVELQCTKLYNCYVTKLIANPAIQSLPHPQMGCSHRTGV